MKEEYNLPQVSFTLEVPVGGAITPSLHLGYLAYHTFAFSVSETRFKGIRDLFLTEIGYQAVSAEVKFLNLIAEWIHMLEFKD